MKRINIILMAFALVVIMTQCKKREETNLNETVTITLDAKRTNGSRVNVNTTTGTVDFENGDKVYVGSGGKYVGFLTHNGTNFVGNITNPTEGQPLQFYFLGNVIPAETLTAGTTETCSVVISDQTEHLPVISCAASYENYVSGVTSYTGHLLNKCALVKFNVTTPSNSSICITGMNNKVTVDFSQNTMTPSMDGEGQIMLPAGSGENVEKWAILLPQEALSEGGDGSAYSADGFSTGIRPAIPVITENNYLTDGINITLEGSDTPNVPEGAINGLFTINENGNQIYFSQGNLQYQASTNIWRFAESQWDYVGTGTSGTVYEDGEKCDNSSISSTYSGWIDLFGWGTSGYHDTSDPYNVYYQPWSISNIGGENAVNMDYNFWGYGPSTNMASPDLTGYSANYDWGVYNPISNGGNTCNQWRSMTRDEWSYVLFDRNTTSDIRYAKANVCDVNGVILLPDDWNESVFSLNNVNSNNANFTSNILTAMQWNNLEQAGAVFLPTVGTRTYNVVSTSYGYYWTASCHGDNSSFACDVYFSFSHLGVFSGNGNRLRGRGVRLVQDHHL